MSKTKVMLFVVNDTKSFRKAVRRLDGNPGMVKHANLISQEKFIAESALDFGYEFTIHTQGERIPRMMQRMICWTQDGFNMLFDEGC